MFAKFVLLLFCCALINAKSLVRRDPRSEFSVDDEKKFERFPAIFKNVIRNVEDLEVKDDQVGAGPQVQDDEADNDEDESEDDIIDDTVKSEKNKEENIKEKSDKDDDEKNEEDSEEEEEEKEEDNEDKEDKDNENNDQVKKSDEDEDEEEEEEEKSVEEGEKGSDENRKDIDEEESEEKSSEEEDSDTPQKTPNLKPSYSTVGAERQSPKSVFSAAEFNLLQDALQNPAINKHINTLANVVDWQKMAKNFLPSVEKFLPNNLEQSEVNFYDMDEDKLKQHIDLMEKNNANVETEFEPRKPSTKLEFNWDDLNMNPAVGNFISQAIPENIRNLQIPAKFQGLKDMWMNNVNRHFKAPVQKQPKVGFGGWNKQQKAMFGDLTSYVNKAVEQAQTKLEDNGRSIEANNPPITINVIPKTPITFKLKRVEGAHTIDKYGQSRAIRYNKLYAFTQYKFTELRYYYDVLIEPFNLFGIRKSITIILNDARTRMNLSVENDQKLNLLGLEFVNPNVMIDCNTDRFTNYAVNYLINDVHQVIKQKVVEIVSRDSKLILTNYLKDAQ